MPDTRPRDTDVYLDPEVERQLANRLSRIQGQLEGVKRMLEEQQSCDDILVQMAAAKKAMNGAARQLLENHMETCVRDSVEGGDAGEALDSLRGALAKFLEHA
ncbi:MAG: metal-sensitive transcriptional regulator [Gemmatimonadota bacterium]